MSALVQSIPHHLHLPTKHRRALALFVLAALLARSAPLSNHDGLLHNWKKQRAFRREEKKRRERETPLNTPALEKKLVDLYIPDPSGSRTLLVPHMGRISKVRITPTKKELYAAHLASFPPLDPSERLGVNNKFWKMLVAVLKIAIPSKTGKEAFLLVLHTFFLLARTVLSVMVARLDGRLVSANGAGFLRGLLWWFTLAVPSTYTNSMIRYLERKLALAFRTNLTRYIHDLYLNDNLNYYKFGIGLGAHLPTAKDSSSSTNEAAAGTADQRSTLLRLAGIPLLAAALGPAGTVGLFANYGLTAWVLKKATPAFGRMAATEARLEGDYRAGLSRIGRDGEEVAFYNGGRREKGILSTAYERLTRHVHSVYKNSIWDDRRLRHQPAYAMSNVHGQVVVGPNHLLLRSVPVVAPSAAARGGEELIHSLDLRVEQGEHTLITGPKIIAQLWPTWAGLLERPVHGEGGLLLLPQRPYLSIGSLRDHPHSYAEMKSRGRTDSELMSILEHMELISCSGGEKQRMGMARLFYHRPSFAILDECTSAVSSDVEGLMYEHAKSLGITLVTISHRPSLLKYHKRHLRLGDTPSAAPNSPLTSHLPPNPSTPLASQGWQLTTLTSSTAEEKLELDLEIERIEKALQHDVETWERRLSDINRELSGKR
ncbi:hypothetical protein IAR55_006248 [Kwoniella newhampshirensis]|uniref:ABC transporter domain-containing protein n=1 Tax=Kwoniella newhampshirensis TaxID=1651941 RepID=A0AAW0YSB3_9TREE